MNGKNPRVYFLLILLASSGILSFFILRPFLYTLLLAAVFAVALHPLHRKILSGIGNKHALAALLTILVFVVFIVAPLSFLGAQIFREARDAYASIASDNSAGQLIEYARAFIDTLRLRAGFSAESFPEIDVAHYLRQGLGWLLEHAGSIFTSMLSVLLHGFVFLFACYYFLKDGGGLRRAIISASPLADADDELVLRKLEVAIHSVVRGGLIVAVIQGILTSIGFALFGVPQPALWGSAAAIAALIPGIGTALVIGPAIIFLFIVGSSGAALGLLAWGALAVGLVDNLLGPKLIERGVRIHPFLLLLSVLGGIAFFGPIGFLLGPLTLSLFFALAEVYASIVKKPEITSRA